MGKLLSWCRAAKGSVIAFVLMLLLGLLSMGFLGAGLYYLASPVLRLRFPPLDQWQGDWVWPSLILSGMGWSFGFLLAGWLNGWLQERLPSLLRRLVYMGVLWGWAVAVWWLILTFPPN